MQRQWDTLSHLVTHGTLQPQHHKQEHHQLGTVASQGRSAAVLVPLLEGS